MRLRIFDARTCNDTASSEPSDSQQRSSYDTGKQQQRGTRNMAHGANRVLSDVLYDGRSEAAECVLDGLYGLVDDVEDSGAHDDDEDGVGHCDGVCVVVNITMEAS